jgi:hypothetical protein
MTTMAKICFVIVGLLKSSGKPLTEEDIFLDWGSGAGRFLICAPTLLGLSNLGSIGLECEGTLFKACQMTMQKYRESGFRVFVDAAHVQSQTLKSFHPARVVWNFDGHPVPVNQISATAKGSIHKEVMTLAFCTPSVDIVASTRMNNATFQFYFPEPQMLGFSRWRPHRIAGCTFDNTQLLVYVWVRCTAMQMPTQALYDPTIQNLVNSIRSKAKQS